MWFPHRHSYFQFFSFYIFFTCSSKIFYIALFMLSQAPCAPSGSHLKLEGQAVTCHPMSQEAMEKNYPQKNHRSALLQEILLTDLVVKNKSTDTHRRFSPLSITRRSQPQHKRNCKSEFSELLTFSYCFSKRQENDRTHMK